MRTQIKLHLKRLVSLCIALAMMLSAIGITRTVAYAAENDFEEVTLALSSNVVDDDVIDLYLLDAVYYISLDDLCRLTRSTKSVDGDVISVTQGIWCAEFDAANQTFNDAYQTIDITVLKISNGDYAVPALMFLSYYKAMATVKSDVLYCDLPAYTAWEALDLDYSNSLVNIYELYGGKGNVELSLTLDILMDFIMGKNPATEKYLKSAYSEALDVDIYSYGAVKQYVNEQNEAVYNDLVADETQNLLDSLSDICGGGDATNKITQEAMDLYILFHYTGQTRDFYNLAYNAMEIGDTTSVRRYVDQIASVWREGEFQKSLVNNNAKSVEGAFFLLSSAVEAAQQIKYTHQENNLVYRVMGQENMKKLSLDVGDNEWYTVANVYKSTATSLQNSFVNILEDLQAVAINDLVSEAAEKIGVDTFLESAASKATGIKGITAASWKIGLEVGRGAVQLFSWIDSLAEPDSLVDILFVDVGAYESDRLALYLSELQQNVYWILCNERERMYSNLDDATAYQDYIYAQQLYCRTSIAMYENLIAMNDEFGDDRAYWQSLFQERINTLAVSLYQLTAIQDDGVNDCLPLDLSTFNVDAQEDVYVDDVYSQDIRVNDNLLYGYHIPRVHLSGNYADAINTEIYNSLYSVAEDSVKQIGEYGYPSSSAGISYRWAVNGNILSLVILRQGEYALDEYMVYNINISSGEEVSTASLIQAAGLSEGEYYEKAKQVLGSRFWSGWDPSSANFGYQYFVDFFNEQLKRTISNENIDQSHPYINENGQLCMIVRLYSLAGADSYWHDLNMIEFELSPYYASEAVKITHAINISEDEAYQIACDYWDYSEGDVAEESGFELYLVFDGLTEKADGNHYYAFRLRWLVNEGHMSTVDYLYINAETGETSYSV